MRRPSREAVLTILGGEQLTASVIAQRLGSSPSAVQRQLIELEQAGRVERLTSGLNLVAWKVVGA